jgi:hypothetical protein
MSPFRSRTLNLLACYLSFSLVRFIDLNIQTTLGIPLAKKNTGIQFCVVINGMSSRRAIEILILFFASGDSSRERKKVVFEL